MCFGKTELPGNARVLDACQGRRAGAAIISTDEDNVSVCLCDTRGDGADANLSDQLDADAGTRVCVLQVVDQLREIFDGIDVVVRRRRDQSDARRRMSHLCNLGIDLVTRELAALARL